MKRQATKFALVLLLLVAFINNQLSGQCPAGNYASYVTLAMALTQGFTLGKTGFTITFPGGVTNLGDDNTNTAEAGSFGAGTDFDAFKNNKINEWN